MTGRNWQPNISAELLIKRASVLKSIRSFFDQRGVTEVETPLMSYYGVTDLYLENMVCTNRFGTMHLQTSPEYAMKRILASESIDIFQLGKAFRDDELGRLHNPEFTLLEWYRVGWDHFKLMQEVDELLQLILHCDPAVQVSYAQLFKQVLDVDIFTVSLDTLQKHVKEQGNGPELGSIDECLQYLFSMAIEPDLGTDAPVLVYDYPANQSSLSQISKNDPRVCERFEAFYQGIELANGFHELTSANEQRRRFDMDNARRKEQGKSTKEIDPNLMEALAQPLPDCAGVALGVDRLIMLSLNKSSIHEVMTFSVDQA